MNYLYYPGCSLTASAREYDLATRAVMAAAGVKLTEIDGWTCCGASAAAPISHLLSLSLSARNLALAEQAADDGQVLVPCSACYLNLKKAHESKGVNTRAILGAHVVTLAHALGGVMALPEHCE